MKRLTVQIQPEVLSGFKADQVISLLESLRGFGYQISTERSGEGGDYINVNFRAWDLIGLWESIRSILRLEPGVGLSRAPVIIVCEGDDGWNDYRLLYHFDENIRLDSLSSPSKQ
jgi:hypothetical protein